MKNKPLKNFFISCYYMTQTVCLKYRIESNISILPVNLDICNIFYV